MTRDILNKSNPGVSTTFTADDIDYINKLLTGVDQSGSDPVDINTTFKFRSSKLKIANPGNTFGYIFAGGALAGGTPGGTDRTLMLPLITSGTNADVLATEAFSQTLSNKVLDPGNNNVISGVNITPEYRHMGGWVGGGTAAPFGTFLGANVTVAGTGTLTNDANGKYCNWATTTTSGSDGGQLYYNATEPGVGSVSRLLNGRFKCKFRLNGTITNLRMFVGLANLSSTSFLTGDDPLNAAQGVMLCTRAADTNFQIARNDGSGATTFTSTGVAMDTAIHTIEIRAAPNDSGFQWSLDGGAYTFYDTDIPASTTPLYGIAQIETANTTAKNWDIWWWYTDELSDPDFGRRFTRMIWLTTRTHTVQRDLANSILDVGDMVVYHFGLGVTPSSAQLDALDAVTVVPQKRKGLEFFQLSDIQANAATAASRGYGFISYDLEAGTSPSGEVSAPTTSFTTAKTYTDAAGIGLQAACSHAISNVDANINGIAPLCTSYHLQSQGRQDNDTTGNDMRDWVNGRVKVIEAANSALARRISCQTTVSSNIQTGKTAYETVRDCIDKVASPVTIAGSNAAGGIAGTPNNKIDGLSIFWNGAAWDDGTYQELLSYFETCYS